MMSGWSCVCVCGGIALFTAFSVRLASGDLIKLKNGGEVRGIVKSKEKDRNAVKDTITIETLIGTTIILDRKDIEFLTRRPLVVEEYESQKQTTSNTIEAQWELAEWCRKRGLKDQRFCHLKRILEIDPDYKRARYGLGHTKRDGQWTSPEEFNRSMKEQGYVKFKGRYITSQELELREKSQVELDSERAWYKKVQLWLGWLQGRHAGRRRQGLAELRKINAPDAVAAMTNFMKNNKDKRIRIIYVEILTKISGFKPVPSLVTASLMDSNYEVRFSALNGLSPEQQQVAVPFYERELQNDSNPIVLRAAKALSRFGDEQVVPSLINALLTTHRYKVRVRGSNSPTYSFNKNGLFVDPSANVLPPEIVTGLRAGVYPQGILINQQQAPGQHLRTKTVAIKYEHKNRDVLAALRKLTGKDFGYDQRTWRLWWMANKNSAENVPVLN